MAPPASLAVILFRFAPNNSICLTNSTIPVSANLEILLSLPLMALLSGNIICANPPILVTGSLNAIPTQDPRPKVVTPLGLTQTFRSAIPTFIISLITIYLSLIFLCTYIKPKEDRIFAYDSKSGIKIKYPSISTSS